MSIRTLLDTFSKKLTGVNKELKSLEKDAENIEAQLAVQADAKKEMRSAQAHKAFLEGQIEDLRGDHAAALFDGDEKKLSGISKRRDEIRAEIESTQATISQQQKIVRENEPDQTLAAEVKADLDLMRIPDIESFMRELRKLLITERTGLQNRIRTARNNLGAYDQAHYDELRKKRDSSYRTHAEVRDSAKQRKLREEQDRARFLNSKPIMLQDGKRVKV